MNKKQLVGNLTSEVEKLERIIENRRLYNIRNAVVRGLIHSGIAIDYALPLILSGAVIFGIQAAKGDAPFTYDEIIDPAKIEMIDTSAGVHIENRSYDFDYPDNDLEYSTGWTVNDRGLYERTVTSYQVSDEIDLNDTEKVLSMSQEEIEKLLVVTNVETIQKSELSPEDSIYDEESVVIINHIVSEEDGIVREESFEENFVNSLFFITRLIFWGNLLNIIRKHFIRVYLVDKIGDYISKFRRISSDDIDEITKILAVKKQNLALLTDSQTNENNGYQYSVRRV